MPIATSSASASNLFQPYYHGHATPIPYVVNTTSRETDVSQRQGMFRRLIKVRQHCGGFQVFKTTFFLTLVRSTWPFGGESSPKGNESELSDKNGGRMSSVSNLRVLIG